MSLFTTKCLLCEGPFQPKEPCFSTWGVFFSSEDPLFPYCDGPMHWSCYASWPERPRFARVYFDSWRRGGPARKEDCNR